MLEQKRTNKKLKKKKETRETKKKKETRVTCEVVTPQRQDQVWSRGIAMLLLNLRTARLLNLKIESANSILVHNWGIFSQKRVHLMFCS